MQRDYNWQYIKASTHMNKFEQTVYDERSFMQIKWTSGQFRIMTSAPEYTAGRYVRWEEGRPMKAVTRRLLRKKEIDIIRLSLSVGSSRDTRDRLRPSGHTATNHTSATIQPRIKLAISSESVAWTWRCPRFVSGCSTAQLLQWAARRFEVVSNNPQSPPPAGDATWRPPRRRRRRRFKALTGKRRRHPADTQRDTGRRRRQLTAGAAPASCATLSHTRLILLGACYFPYESTPHPHRPAPTYCTANYTKLISR